MCHILRSFRYNVAIHFQEIVMNLEVFDIIIFITGAALGLIVGLTVKKGQQSASNTPNQANLTTEAMKFEAERKQAELDDFFSQTNEKLLSTEKVISELKQQIATGASSLASIEIESKDTPIKEDNEESIATPAEPPKDYSSNTSGTLSEGFGFKAESTEQNPSK